MIETTTAASVAVTAVLLLAGQPDSYHPFNAESCKKGDLVIF